MYATISQFTDVNFQVDFIKTSYFLHSSTPVRCHHFDYQFQYSIVLEMDIASIIIVNLNFVIEGNSAVRKIGCTYVFNVFFHQALSGDCGFMAANLYAKSIFGEDVLANLSIEKPVHLPATSPVQGHIRIRAKSQVSQHLCYHSGSKVIFLY